MGEGEKNEKKINESNKLEGETKKNKEWEEKPVLWTT
jgi:hypothetical protein